MFCAFRSATCTLVTRNAFHVAFHIWKFAQSKCSAYWRGKGGRLKLINSCQFDKRLQIVFQSTLIKIKTNWKVETIYNAQSPIGRSNEENEIFKEIAGLWNENLIYLDWSICMHSRHIPQCWFQYHVWQINSAQTKQHHMQWNQLIIIVSRRSINAVNGVSQAQQKTAWRLIEIELTKYFLCISIRFICIGDFIET